MQNPQRVPSQVEEDVRGGVRHARVCTCRQIVFVLLSCEAGGRMCGVCAHRRRSPKNPEKGNQKGWAVWQVLRRKMERSGGRGAGALGGYGRGQSVVQPIPS